MAKLESLDLLQRTDHDTIVRLEAKVDSMISTLSELKDGTALRIADHESRIRGMERMNDDIRPVELMKQVQENSAWIHDFKVSWKAIVGVVIIITSVITFILTTLSETLHIFK